MFLTIEKIGPVEFPLYDSIPSRFKVESIYRVDEIDHGLGGFRMAEFKLEEPYLKDYDADGGNTTTAWAKEFDVNNWGIFLATKNGKPVGGAAVAVGMELYPLDKFQREDLVVLWDIRVHPEARNQGIARRVFHHAADWAKSMDFGQLGMETQNVNVPACKFYVRMGCKLGAIHRYGYAGCPPVASEVMLLWYYDLR